METAVKGVGRFEDWELYCDPVVRVWQSDEGLARTPCYYPVYRYQDYYSHSPIPLIHLKGAFVPDRKYLAMARLRQLPYIATQRSIDREITRIGAPRFSSREIQSTDLYVNQTAKALQEDMAAVEKALPGYTMVILCGGKDSQNLLLLPWRNPVLVVSGEPNYPLVKQFVRENQLAWPCVWLDDSGADAAVGLASLGALDLQHFRWIRHLRQIAADHGNKVCFISGHLGDVYMTGHWSSLIDFSTPWFLSYFPVRYGLWRLRNRLRKWWYAGAGNGDSQRYFEHCLYWRCAMWQGMYTSVMRTVLGTPVLSGYHGNAFQELVSKVDLEHCVKADVRPAIGKALLGREVWYPEKNPSPPMIPTVQRVGMREIVRALRGD